MDGKAVLLTQGMLDTQNAKTAHGLIRSSDRYQVVGVIDNKYAGNDAGQVLDGRHRNIPIYDSVNSLIDSGVSAEFLIIGIATKGGYIPDPIKGEVRRALSFGMSIVNGLHEFLSDDPEMRNLARDNSQQLIDIRKPRPKESVKVLGGLN